MVKLLYTLAVVVVLCSAHSLVDPIMTNRGTNNSVIQLVLTAGVSNKAPSTRDTPETHTRQTQHPRIVGLSTSYIG